MSPFKIAGPWRPNLEGIFYNVRLVSALLAYSGGRQGNYRLTTIL